MNNLKQLTNDIHRKAENSPWAKLLISGDMTPEQYGTYLWNQLAVYEALENRALEKKVLSATLAKRLRRVHYINDDINYYPKIWKKFPATFEYVEYCKKIQPDQIWAHIYVRHFGDMFGGNMIKEKLPKPKPQIDNMPPSELKYPGQMYYYFENKSEIITEVRSQLNDSMVDECIYCFESATKLFNNLEKHYNVS
ncbi:MAG: hypothetical protein CBB96_05620 [Gammaproteobacteria bacterium TMED36]|nr:MAG: hypothetical protein CBB96_05620 [Gammaproteobacteria bacterium TMED36]